MKRFFILLVGIVVALGASFAAPIQKKVINQTNTEKVQVKQSLRAGAQPKAAKAALVSDVKKAQIAERAKMRPTFSKANKAKEGEIEIVATNIELDDSYVSWFGIWIVSASNADYAVEAYLEPEDIENPYGNYSSEDVNISLYITNLATEEEVEAIVESATLASTESGDVFTGLASDSLGNSYKLDFSFVIPERADSINLAFPNSASVKYYDADGDFYIYSANDEGWQVAIDIVTEQLPGNYESADFLLQYTKMANPDGDLLKVFEAKAQIEQLTELTYSIKAELFASDANVYFCDLFYEVPTAKDTVVLELEPGLVRNYLDLDGSFLVSAESADGVYALQLNTISLDGETFDGTYSFADIDEEYSSIEIDGKAFDFAESDAQFTVATINDHQWSFKGAILAVNSVLYEFDFVADDADYEEPLEAITDTVAFEAAIGASAEFFDFDGSYQVIAYTADSLIGISLTPFTDGTWEGSFTYADLDKSYSYIVKDSSRISFAEWENTGFVAALDGGILNIEGSLAARDGVLYVFKLSGEVIPEGGDTITDIEFNYGQAVYLTNKYKDQLEGHVWEVDAVNVIDNEGNYDAWLSTAVTTQSETSISGTYDVASTLWTSIEIPVNGSLKEIKFVDGVIEIARSGEDQEGYPVYRFHVAGNAEDNNFYDLSYEGIFIPYDAETEEDIVMTDVLAGVEVVKAEELVRVVNNSLVVEAQGDVQIYNVSGQLLYSVKSNGNAVINGLNHGQVVIVRVNDKAAKVVF